MYGLFDRSFSTHARRVAIWDKAARIPGCDKAIWRCDDAGRVIRWADYRDYYSTYGWTISDLRKAGWLASIFGLTVAKPMHWRSDLTTEGGGQGAFSPASGGGAMTL